MGIDAKVIADSIANGVRLTTIQIKAHRFILPEINTHRSFSRSFSSSRAIPVAKMIEQVKTDPAMPVYWGKNRPGMQAVEELTGEHLNYAKSEWLYAAVSTAGMADDMAKLGVHKQIVNRLLEPFLWVNGVITATEWDNFFKLRDHHAAQPEIRELARAMKNAMDESTPLELSYGEWHLPYVDWDFVQFTDISYETLAKISAARCARVSYNKHDGTSPSIDDDLELYSQLATRPHTDKRGIHYGEDEPVHLSPLEHQATPMRYLDGVWSDRRQTAKDGYGQFWSGNFKGWLQYRQMV